MITTTFAGRIKLQLESAGFSINKNPTNDYWELLDGNNVLLYSRQMGNLLYMAADELGLEI